MFIIIIVSFSLHCLICYFSAHSFNLAFNSFRLILHFTSCIFDVMIEAKKVQEWEAPPVKENVSCRSPPPRLIVWRQITKWFILIIRLPEDWPSHSPDLSPMNYRIWYSLATKVFWINIRNVDHVCERLAEACEETRQEEVNRTTYTFFYKLLGC